MQNVYCGVGKLAWDTCLFHLILAILGYIFLLFAALSGAAYFVVDRFERGFDFGGPAVSESLAFWKSMRFRLNCYYLLLGFAAFTAALVTGAAKADLYWKSGWMRDPKIVFSLIMWVYYFIVILIIPVFMKLKETRKRRFLISALSTAGLAFLGSNLALGYFSKLHHYL